ncbi:ISAon1 family transposase N-terminal region protein [Sphingobacterium pedocola]|uniref:Transposase n=1 Tax=Sphingobacterium pedocola TaxID=2082722 RepID=A0ABR9T7S3_9SPHI|nr:transposase [Sphingobacterium pedocola]MBE8720261.1 transposase [Sphingobacterium pedocola]MBE8720724.1 transposase [Sphingobacterium pedocola]MBE8720924.1 transposase [Sphingobacterium pedocola]MBE8722572.1 transposase [Sphingobacterium pedocola]MBE8723201.1 transposase [Sphingobacterium pedocola]
MQDAERRLLALLMPEGLLDYFDIMEVVQKDKELHIHLDEKNIAPSGYENTKLASKGFMPVSEIKDFPIRGQKVTLHIKRRRWTVSDTRKIITRDWNLVREGARMTTEFGLFLKGIFG